MASGSAQGLRGLDGAPKTLFTSKVVYSTVDQVSSDCEQLILHGLRQGVCVMFGA